KSPETFPRVYTAMVQAGETGGFLDLVLAQIADFQSREKELRSKVVTAMLYPSILLVLAVAVLIFLLTFLSRVFKPSLRVLAQRCHSRHKSSWGFRMQSGRMGCSFWAGWSRSFSW